MDFQAMYKSKLTTAEEAAKLVKSGDWVDYTWCTNHPVGESALKTKKSKTAKI